MGSYSGEAPLLAGAVARGEGTSVACAGVPECVCACVEGPSLQAWLTTRLCAPHSGLRHGDQPSGADPDQDAIPEAVLQGAEHLHPLVSPE